MQEFSGFDYLQIDVANHFGLDKELFESRIQWVRDNMDNLENLVPDADAPIPYVKAVMALRDAQEGKPTGHLMGLDACSSGLQIMACMSGCKVTAENTGLINPGVRADVYTTTTGVMNKLLHQHGIQVDVERDDVKYAQMTHFYGSKEKPKELFGEDTAELAAFYDANYIVAPGACDLMQDLMGSWQPYALTHEWVMPDGFDVRVKVMQQFDVKVEVDELDHATFTHRFSENCGSAKGLSIAANVVHSIDGMVVREMNRRCNHDREYLQARAKKIGELLAYRNVNFHNNTDRFISLNLVDKPIHELREFTTNDLTRLLKLINMVLARESFELVCVHDEFRCGPNHGNTLRYWYKEILAEIAESKIAEDLLNQITGSRGTYQKNSHDLADLIRKSNYALS